MPSIYSQTTAFTNPVSSPDTFSLSSEHFASNTFLSSENWLLVTPVGLPIPPIVLTAVGGRAEPEGERVSSREDEPTDEGL